MRFTAQEEYGLRCLLRLAEGEGNGPLTIHEIAEREALSAAYVGKLMRILSKGDLVTSARGPRGGYALARPAAEIPLAEIFLVLDGPFYANGFCRRFTGTDEECVHLDDCSIRSVWRGVELLLERFLGQTMLRDLLRTERSMDGWLETALSGVRSEDGLPCGAAPLDAKLRESVLGD